MRRLLIIVLLLSISSPGRSSGAAESAAIGVEEQVTRAVQSPGLTVVHLWAPWCPNCRTELADRGWASFIEANPEVHFVFVTIWSADGGDAVLEKEGVAGLKNVTILRHENTERRGPDRVASVAGVPVSWIPTTAVFKKGRLCYMLGYGEVRFPMLQQMLDDSMQSWSR